MTPQIALWLSLLVLLTVLCVYECLHDTLPDAWLSFACIGYAWALMLLAATPEQLVHGFAAGGAGFLLGMLSQAPAAFGRGGAAASAGGSATLAVGGPAPRRVLDGRAYLCVGLVAGWPGILVVSAGWVLLVGIVGFYFAVTNRVHELLAVSFLPFLTLSAVLVFIMRTLLLP
jgi:hypothetical protein